MARFRRVVIVLCLVAAAALGVFALLNPNRLAPKAASGNAPSASSVKIGGDFNLVDQDGKAVDQTLLKGRWSAVFFGFTYCPDICPTTLQNLGAAAAQLGPKAKDLQIIFISVDPERDRPAPLKAYLASPGFPKGVIGLTGTPAQVAAAAKAYKAYFEKDGTGETYLVNHTSLIYLMNPKGEFNRVLAYGLSPDENARQIADAMGGGAGR
jgi:protein SCO1/2